MRCIIAGSRSIGDEFYSDIKDIIYTLVSTTNLNITTIISGGAIGVDNLGEKIAEEFNIPLEIYEADWIKYGKRAGYLRNEEMAKNADCLILFWDGISKGSKHMYNIAKKKGLKIYAYKLSKQPNK